MSMMPTGDMIEMHKIINKKNIDDLGTPGRFGHYMQDVLPAPDQITTTNYNKRGLVGRYKKFKKFDVVDDFSDHLISRHMRDGPDHDNKEVIMKEWEIFKKELRKTNGIFVRVYESRINLLTAAIIGPEGTPYHDGLFFFDILFAGSYPKKSGPQPAVRFHSGGLQLNPRIHSCGEVVLYHYVNNVRTKTWEAGTHNMFDLLVIIRNVLLIANPLSLKSGFDTLEGTQNGHKLSVLYNENTIIKSLKTMIYIINHPPKNFEDLVAGHFFARAHDILTKCRCYIEGGFICGKKEEMCSITFRNDVAACMKPLVKAFVKVGATDALQFLPLSKARFPVPTDLARAEHDIQVGRSNENPHSASPSVAKGTRHGDPPPKQSVRKSARLANFKGM